MEWQAIQIGESDVYKKLPKEAPGPEVLWSVSDDDQQLNYIIFLALIIFTNFIAVLFKQRRLCKRFAEFLPESGFLMLVGCVTSLIFCSIADYLESEHKPLRVSIFVIEHVIIPPIILYAAYDLFHPHFFGQIVEILILAIVATALNALITASVLYAVYSSLEAPGFMNFFHTLIYGSIISAVDPVAVLAVFNSVNADKALYFLVFGESLLNDGVTYVMFDGLKDFARLPGEMLSEIPYYSYLLLMASFVIKPLGGALFGFIMALGSALITKHTSDDEQIAPLKLLLCVLFAALSYCLSISFGFSGIISLIVFGLSQERYTFCNISKHSAAEIVNLVRGVAVIMETLLFFVLGTRIPDIKIAEVYAFALTTLAVIVMSRTIVTFTLIFFINKFRNLHPINWKWQVVIIAGGLRGAIAYAMSLDYNGPFKQMFRETTILIVFITTLGNGILAKPLVTLFDLKQESSQDDFDYDKYYGWDSKWKGNYIARWWNWFEDAVLLKYFTKSHKKQSAADKEKTEKFEEKIYEDLDRDMHDRESCRSFNFR